MTETLEHPRLPQLEQELGLERKSIHTLDDAEFGTLIRSVGAVAANFQRFERQTHAPERSDRMSSLDRNRYSIDRREFEQRMNRLDAYIGKTLTGIIDYASSECPPPLAPRMILLHNNKPSVYYEYWTTYDLDDDMRDPVEICRFIDVANNLETVQGTQIIDALIRHLLVDDYADASFKMARKKVPDSWQTLGTIPREVFEPFVAQD